MGAGSVANVVPACTKNLDLTTIAKIGPSPGPSPGVRVQVLSPGALLGLSNTAGALPGILGVTRRN